ncbi:hypothetical protein TNCV_302181 [Trichonephila clavipes]|nr:hypothetical protein TNCV_302181 [Trichonephila clavipes]
MGLSSGVTTDPLCRNEYAQSPLMLYGCRSWFLSGLVRLRLRFRPRPKSRDPKIKQAPSFPSPNRTLLPTDERDDAKASQPCQGEFSIRPSLSGSTEGGKERREGGRHVA